MKLTEKSGRPKIVKKKDPIQKLAKTIIKDVEKSDWIQTWKKHASQDIFNALFMFHREELVSTIEETIRKNLAQTVADLAFPD